MSEVKASELAAGTVIGVVPCPECGRDAEVRIGRARVRARPKVTIEHRKASAANPAYDGCGSRWYPSREKSDEFIDAWERSVSPAPQPEPKLQPRPEPEPEPRAGPDETDDAGSRDGRSGGHWLDDL